MFGIVFVFAIGEECMKFYPAVFFIDNDVFFSQIIVSELTQNAAKQDFFNPGSV